MLRNAHGLVQNKSLTHFGRHFEMRLKRRFRLPPLVHRRSEEAKARPGIDTFDFQHLPTVQSKLNVTVFQHLHASRVWHGSCMAVMNLLTSVDTAAKREKRASRNHSRSRDHDYS